MKPMKWIHLYMYFSLLFIILMSYFYFKSTESTENTVNSEFKKNKAYNVMW
uniref:ATP synthase F0 subunit 8 n=1 Tax=Neoseiulus chebalingensis TaxID=3061192 RepID=UPI0030FF3538